MDRCPECGRGGKTWHHLSPPALLTLAAMEVAEGTGLNEETLPNLVALRRTLRGAPETIDNWISYKAKAMEEAGVEPAQR